MINYAVIECRKDLDKALEYFKTKEVIGLDVETTAFEPRDGRLRLIQISDGRKTIIIDCFRFLENEGSTEYDIKPEIFLPLKEWLESGKVKVVIHNSKFEYKWLAVFCNIEPAIVFDTFLAAQLIDFNPEKNPEKGHSLQKVLQHYLNVYISKDVEHVWEGELSERQFEYAAEDVYYLPRLRAVLRQELVDTKQLKAAKIDFECAAAVAHTEMAGVKVNREVYAKEIEVIQELRGASHNALQEVLRPTSKVQAVQTRMFDLPEKNYADVLLTSPDKIKKAFRALGVPIFTEKEVLEAKELLKANQRNKKKKPLTEVAKFLQSGKYYTTSTGAKAVKPLEKDYPAIKLLSDVRHTEKLVTSYGESVLSCLVPVRKVKTVPYYLKGQEHERLFPSFHIIGAGTGRMACGGGGSINVQQVPNKPLKVAGKEYQLKLRRAFDFPKGYIGVIGDFSQIELRIAAEMSGDKAFIEAFLTGRDLHSDTASKIYGVPYEDIVNKEHPQYEYYQKFYRAPSKNSNFAICYGTSAMGLSSMGDGMPLEQAEEFLKRYAETYPKLWSFLQNNGRMALKTLQARSMSGRRQVFRAPSKDQYGNVNRSEASLIERNGKNMPIQSTSSDILKRALKLVYDALKPYDARIVNIIHDEIVLEVKEEQAKEVLEILKTNMVKAGEEYLNTVPVKVGADIIKTWGEK